MAQHRKNGGGKRPPRRGNPPTTPPFVSSDTPERKAQEFDDYDRAIVANINSYRSDSDNVYPYN